MQRAEIRLRGHLRGQEIADERAAGRQIGATVFGIPEVGERGESAGARHAEPGPVCLEIAACEHLRRVRPERRRCGGAAEPLVAVRRDDQPVRGVRAVREQNEAHG
jgi:hypothetical protein